MDRTGEVSVDARGYPEFLAADGHWYEAAPAIEGLIWHFEMWCTRHDKKLPLQPLRDLHVALHYLVPVQPSTIAALRDAHPAPHDGLGSPEDQVDLFQQTRIKAAMEAQA